MSKGILKIKVLGDASGVNKAFGDVGSAAHGLGGKLSSLGSSLGKIAGAFAGLYVAKQAAGFLMDAARAAAEDEASQSKLALVVQNVTGATDAQVASMESWITKTQMASGVTDSTLRPALQNLVVATGSVTDAQGLMGVAMDISAAKGLDLETVTKAMQKAHDGNTGALSKLGIATKDAEGKTLDFETIMKNASDTFGGSAAAAADTLSGKTKRIGEMFGEAKESLGAVFLPVLTKFMDWVTAHMPEIQKTFETAFTAIGDAMDWISENVVPPLITAVQKIRQWVDDNRESIEGFWNDVKDAASNLKGFIEEMVPIVIEKVKTMQKDIEPALTEAKKLFDNITGAVGALLKPFGSGGEWSGLASVISVAWTAMYVPLKAMLDTFTFIAGAINAAITAIQKYNNTKPVAHTIPTKNTAHYGTVTQPRGITRALGGPIPGSGPVPITAHGGEYVLTKGDTSLMQQLIAAVKAGQTGGGTKYINIAVSGTSGLDQGRQIAAVLATV